MVAFDKLWSAALGFGLTVQLGCRRVAVWFED